MAHLSFAVAANAMRVESQELADEVAVGFSHLPQSDLKLLSLGDGASVEEVMDSGVTDDKGQSIRQLKASLAQRAQVAQVAIAQGRFVNELQPYPWLDLFW